MKLKGVKKQKIVNINENTHIRELNKTAPIGNISYYEAENMVNTLLLK